MRGRIIGRSVAPANENPTVSSACERQCPERAVKAGPVTLPDASKAYMLRHEAANNVYANCGFNDPGGSMWPAAKLSHDHNRNLAADRLFHYRDDAVIARPA